MKERGRKGRKKGGWKQDRGRRGRGRRNQEKKGEGKMDGWAGRVGVRLRKAKLIAMFPRTYL